MPLRHPARTFAIVANGFAEGPAQALRDYLVSQDADVLTIFHPLTPEQGKRHLLTRYARGRRVVERAVQLPFRPPLSFAFDPFVPLLPPRVDTWFGFNPLACARGLFARGQRRARRAVLWSVDFVPDRFGAGTMATRVYDRLDRLCCLRADARIELSAAALEARRRRHELPATAAPAYVVPMGTWLDRVPTATIESFRRRRVVFLGHLVPRQGVELMLQAVAELVAGGDEVEAYVIGTGPLEASLRERARALGIDRLVTFRGFVPDHREVEELLSSASVAVAPYEPSPDSFTRFADPGKLKVYLAAGLPIVLTDVPPNAYELAREAGAEIALHEAAAFANGISAALASPDRWRERSTAARAYAEGFDWAVLLPDVLREIGVDAT
jgi:glycosyltransferase involved in cell wall biosynthesis